MNYRHSFFYWAAFISHGFASVLLDDALLDEVHARLQRFWQESSRDDTEGGGGERTMETVMLTLTRDAYNRLGEREEALSRKWCDMWGVQWATSAHLPLL